MILYNVRFRQINVSVFGTETIIYNNGSIDISDSFKLLSLVQKMRKCPSDVSVSETWGRLDLAVPFTPSTPNSIVCACAILKDRPVCYGTSRLKSRVCAVTRCALLKTPTLKSN